MLELMWKAGAETFLVTQWREDVKQTSGNSMTSELRLSAEFQLDKRPYHKQKVKSA